MKELEKRIKSLIKSSKKARDYSLANKLFGVLLEIISSGNEPEERIRLEITENEPELLLEDKGEEISGIHYFDLLYVDEVCIPMPLLKKKAIDFLHNTPLWDIGERDFSIRHGNNGKALPLSEQEWEEIEKIVTQFPQWESWVKIED